jgi:Transposase
VPAHVIVSVVGERLRGAHTRGFSRLLVSLPFAGHCGGGRGRRLLTDCEGRTLVYFDSNTQSASVAGVIDAVVVAHHHVCVRTFAADGRVNVFRFQVLPTVTGLQALTTRLEPYPGVLAVAEPTSMTWLGLAVALQDAGSDLALVGSRHAARERGAISGKNKSDVIDVDVLARAGDVFELHPLVLASPPQLALLRDGH